MEEEVLRKYLEAGRVARRALEEGLKLVEAGRRLLDVCEKVENIIRELGGEPAFPCNITLNEAAAHYTPVIGDESVIPEGAVVKLDVGVHIDGYIADTAATVDLSGKFERLLEAVKEALEKALMACKPGVPFREIGGVVEKVIRGYGYNPIVNLAGHSLGRYLVHAGESIPNFRDESIEGVFEPGKAYAIEPFGTTGVGYVVEKEPVTIYSLNPNPPPLRSRRVKPVEKKLLAEIASRFRTLPFTERWFDPSKYGGLEQLRLAFRRLWRMGFLIGYPVLVEKSGGIVAQFEHTVVVLKDQIIITTGKE